jgi:hypothetical protein
MPGRLRSCYRASNKNLALALEKKAGRNHRLNWSAGFGVNKIFGASTTKIQQ